jgi:two-component system, OmpR family, sensor kinase
VIGGPSLWQRLVGSIRVRILAAVLVLLAGSSAVSIVQLRSVLLDRVDEEVMVGLRRETEEFQLLASGLNPQTGEPFGSDLKAIFDVYFAREVPDDGESLMAFHGDDLYHFEAAHDSVPPDRLDGVIEYWLSLKHPELGSIDTAAGHTRYSALPLTGTDGPGLLMVVNFPEAERSEINGAVSTQALTQFGTMLLALLVGLALAGRVLRPLGRLADTAQNISATDLTQRIPVQGDDEATRIARAFNDMLGRLERAFATQRQFLDDANHELRAPLTVIRGHVELLDLLPDAEDRSETVQLIVGEIERMNRIVDELLLLARSERPGFLSVAPVDVDELTREMHRKAAVMCERDWALEQTARVTVTADAQRLTQALVQLAQNACQHTPPGTPVRIGSAAEPGAVRFWVHDAGPGIPAEDATRIFQRFAKGSEQTGGSGLGLSIVAAIAEAHGGQAQLAPGPYTGARFEIVIPR